MNELKVMEHATLKVPYEIFNKRYRNAQRVLDVEARQVSASSGDIDSAVRKPFTAGEIDSLLGGMVEKLTAMKRKASEAITEEVQAAMVCKKRLEHLKVQSEPLSEPTTSQNKAKMNQWRKVRLDRMLVDYFLRNGNYDSAKKLADARGLRELTNVDIYAQAAMVEKELRERRTVRCLQWCNENKSKLKKINSNMEFNIRVQEFVELVRADKRLEAVRYAKKHFSAFEVSHLEQIQHCMGMLAFPKDTVLEPYASLLCVSRWTELVSQFRREHGRLFHPARAPLLPTTLQLGLHALNTPYLELQKRNEYQTHTTTLNRAVPETEHAIHCALQKCYKEVSRVSACPSCQPPLSALARTLPHAYCSQSRLVCRLSGLPLNEHNHPMALPNGQVYGEKGLKEMMKEQGSITCPETKEVFCMKRAEKVYIM